MAAWHDAGFTTGAVDVIETEDRAEGELWEALEPAEPVSLKNGDEADIGRGAAEVMSPKEEEQRMVVN